MRPTEFSAELDFQDLLARFPELLVGDQIDPEQPRRFMLVKQEQAIGHGAEPCRWSMDHLFVDQDGNPHVGGGQAEIRYPPSTGSKSGRCSSTRPIARVIGLRSPCRAAAEATCAASGRSYDESMATLLGPDGSEDALWGSVKTNLTAGKLRLLLVADEVPSEVRIIVEFLNRQMNPAEILAIELRQYTGQGLRTVVPLVVGQVQDATLRRASTPGVRWTEDRFLAKIADEFSVGGRGCGSRDPDLDEGNGVAAGLGRWSRQTAPCPLFSG